MVCLAFKMVFHLSHFSGKTFVASEPSAFGIHAKRFLPLEDKEIVVLNVENSSLDVTRIQQNRNEAVTATTPDPYPHWTIKGIVGTLFNTLFFT